MGNVISIIVFVLIMSAIIIVHELGHLIAAKRFGVYCKEFSIGMGPVLWQRQIGETAWSLRALPIGGFVAMAGEDSTEDDEELNIPYERTLNGIKRWKQIVVMAAGAFMNVVLAWVIFVGITAYQGQVSVPGQPVVAGVSEGKPAEKAGFKEGDRIIKIQQGDEIETPESWSDVTKFLVYYQGEMTFTVERNEKQVELKLTPYLDKETNQYMMGVLQDPNSYTVKDITLLESIPYGTEKMVSSVSMIFEALGKLIQGIGLNNLSGPVGIFKVTADVAKEGFLSIVALTGLLSVNVGIFNLLPIPILDGGRIFILLIEAVIGRKLNEKVQNAVMMAGLVLLVGIMLFATWNDITRLF
ncbi:MAG: RIP metalloprotease RseP [Longicatena sp.]